MANEEQVKRLLAGVEGWNKWRRENPEEKLDLARADFRGAKLMGANLVTANLLWADLREADLRRAYLTDSDLRKVNLSGADLTKVYLKGANLREASLGGTNLSIANLDDTLWEGTWLEGTVFGINDLSKAKGLEEVKHVGASIIDTKTLQRSQGKIPEKFLRGCGLSDWEIESAKLYQPELSAKDVNDIVYRIYELRARQAIQINPLFISYSHADGGFVDVMEKHLDEKGIRFWRDIHHATAGRLEKVVDRAIRQNPTVLLVLSENSVKSDWVEHEARSARELEKELGRDVLCPVALDGAWKDCQWPARLREQIMDYNILDFSKWRDEEEMGRMFGRMVEGLDLFYKEG